MPAPIQRPWFCGWCKCGEADSKGNRLTGPNGPSELCHPCGYRYRRGNTGPPPKDKDGNFLCTTCKRSFSSVQGLGIHRRRMKECGKDADKKHRMKRQWGGSIQGWTPAEIGQVTEATAKAAKNKSKGAKRTRLDADALAAAEAKRPKGLEGDVEVGDKVSYLFNVEEDPAGAWYSGEVTKKTRSDWFEVKFDDGETLQVRINEEIRGTIWCLLKKKVVPVPAVTTAAPAAKRAIKGSKLGKVEGTTRRQYLEPISKLKKVPVPQNGSVVFQNMQVERRMRSRTVPSSTTEEPRLGVECIDPPILVLDTGTPKEFGAFASRALEVDEYLGEYVGVVSPPLPRHAPRCSPNGCAIF